MDATGTVQYLDMFRFPQDHVIEVLSPYSQLRQTSSLMSVVHRCRPALDSMQHTGLLATVNSRGEAVASVGFAMTNPNLTFEQVGELWDSPEELIYMVGGFGDKWRQYAANGGRKIRPAARECKISLCLSMYEPDSFVNKVESVDDQGRFAWGDFPWGGAVWIPLSNGKGFWIAASAFKEDEDQLASYVFGGAIATELERAIALELSLAA